MKDKTTAALLAFFLGGLGIHRFYLNQAGLGILYLVFSWTFIPLFIAFIDFIAFLTTSDEKFNLKYNKEGNNYTKQPISKKSNNVVNDNPNPNQLMEVKGILCTLIILKRKIIIAPKGLMTKGTFKGNKEIPIKNITAIEFKSPGSLTSGFLQFSIHGEMGHKGGGLSVAYDENTVMFQKPEEGNFYKAKELIESLMEELENSQNSNGISHADELKKFAELKDSGVISEEEYEKKKKQILNL